MEVFFLFIMSLFIFIFMSTILILEYREGKLSTFEFTVSMIFAAILSMIFAYLSLTTPLGG